MAKAGCMYTQDLICSLQYLIAIDMTEFIKIQYDFCESVLNCPATPYHSTTNLHQGMNFLNNFKTLRPTKILFTLNV